MTDKDFDNDFNPIFYSWDDGEGEFVKLRDYQELLAAYKELKWMYEELCK